VQTVAHEESRKLKKYMKNISPCKDCISYAVCQNEDVVAAICRCAILSTSIAGSGYKNNKEGLYITISNEEKILNGYRYYVYYYGTYLGNFINLGYWSKDYG